MSILINFLLAINVLVCLLLILLVLMQRPKSEGLGVAFGGGMTEAFLGTQTANVLANATRWLLGFFFILNLGLSILYAHQNKESSLSKQLANAPKPVVTATPAESGTNAADAAKAHVLEEAQKETTQNEIAPAPAASPTVGTAPTTPAAPAASATPAASAAPSATPVAAATPAEKDSAAAKATPAAKKKK